MSALIRTVVLAVVCLGCGRSELLGPRDFAAGLPGFPDGGRSASDACVATDAGVAELDVVTAFREGCIDVRYTDEIAGELPLLREALARWAAPACTGLCFDEPRPFDGRPNPPHQILLHWDHGGLRPSDGVIAVWYTNVVRNSRVRDYASIVRRPGTTATAEDYLSAVGQVVGFTATPGVESAISERRTTLTSADQQSVCSVYPCPQP